MLNNKPLAYFLLIIFAVAAFMFLVPPKMDSPAHLELKRKLVGMTTEIQEVAPLIRFKRRHDNEHRLNLGYNADNFFNDMFDELNWLSKERVKNNDDAQKFFELTLAARYTKTAWEWLDKENFPDTERYLKAAKEHLQKAKEIVQLQERRKNDVIQ